MSRARKPASERTLWARVLRARSDLAATRTNSETLLRITHDVANAVADSETELRDLRTELARTGELTPSSGSDPDPSAGVSPIFPGQATILMPDRRLRSAVGPPSAFHEVALTTIGRMNMAGLRPDHDVLDVDCGVGRTARYLCDYLDTKANYNGFDIAEDVLRWCQTHITPLFPNFRFQFVPLFNTAYNPDPTLPSAATFVFPYPDQSFDFAFAHSVFTHMMPDVTDNYLREISRVLRPRGISYSTWFLFNDDPLAYTNPVSKPFRRDPSGNFAVRDLSVPEAAIGYSESFVRAAYSSSRLTIVEPFHPGF